MRIAKLARSLAALTILAIAQGAGAIEVGLDTDATNIHIPWSRQTPMSADRFPRDYYFWGGDAWLSAPIGEDASVRLAYERDIVLRNTISSTVRFERGIVQVSAGPIFGLFNSDSCSFSAGMTAAVRFQWPGVAYVSARSDGGTAIASFQDKAAPQERAVLSAGFYVPNAIVSGIVTIKRFNELDGDGELVSDVLKRYEMTVDVFKKNVPYTTLLSIGYEQRSKHYDAASETDSLGSIVLGLDATLHVDKSLALKGGFSSGAYVFGMDAMHGRGPGSSAFMFALDFGVAVDVSRLLSAKGIGAPRKAESGEGAGAAAPTAAEPSTAPAPEASAPSSPDAASPAEPGAATDAAPPAAEDTPAEPQ